jgi:hypothetical protein
VKEGLKLQRPHANERLEGSRTVHQQAAEEGGDGGDARRVQEGPVAGIGDVGVENGRCLWHKHQAQVARIRAGLAR